MTVIRTTVDADLYARAKRKADADGITLSALLRDLLTGWLDGEPVPDATRSTGRMSTAEMSQMRAWNLHVMVGNWAGQKPADWRAAIDPLLREQGHEGIPPLPEPGDHVALIAWAHAVHRIITPLSHVFPPRWTGEQP